MVRQGSPERRRRAHHERLNLKLSRLKLVAELSNSPADPDVSIARARVKPGVTTKLHRLTGVVERYVILSGQAIVEVGEREPQPLSIGDVVIIPSLCPQRITNSVIKLILNLG